MLHTLLLPVLNDNYIFLLHEDVHGVTAVVDPAEAAPVLDALAVRGWRLDRILNTHHHGDHVGGNRALVQATGCGVSGYGPDAARIPGLDDPRTDRQTFLLGAQPVHVWHTPGHTSGHCVYYLPEAQALFCGDTLFAMGCGRLFEGTPAEMLVSLARLAALPGETRVYCAHEYTAHNGAFALTVDPDNPALQERMLQVQAARAAGQPTIPSTVALERATNPFLRALDPTARPALARACGLPADTDALAVFTELRQRRNGW